MEVSNRCLLTLTATRASETREEIREANQKHKQTLKEYDDFLKQTHRGREREQEAATERGSHDYNVSNIQNLTERNSYGLTIDDLHPQTLGGVERTQEFMTYEEANHNSCNSRFDFGIEYQMNCQSCVVAYEARRRGYHVEAQPNLKQIQSDLGRNRKLAWENIFEFDDKMKSLSTQGDGTTLSVYNFLDSTVKDNERYFLGYVSKNNEIHIVNLEKMNKELCIIDNQNGVSEKVKNKICAFFKLVNIEYNNPKDERFMVSGIQYLE